MAIYYFHVGIKGRGSGKSPRVIASAAYKSASRLIEKVYDKNTGQILEFTHDYTNKNGVVFSQIFLPHNAPERFKNAEVLWNEVVSTEKRKDSQFCRDFTIALPKEFNSERNKELVKAYVEKVFVERGIIAHASIHMDDENNPHAHIMAAMRDVSENGFGKKNREWITDSSKLYERESWAEMTNEHLAKYGFLERVTHLSYKERGLDIEPTVHEGYYARQIEERGGIAELCEVNREVKLRNIDKILEDPKQLLEVKFFNQATFTEEDIEKAVHDATEGQPDIYNQILNKIKACPEIVKLEHADLKGNTRYSFKEYVEQEQSLFNNAKELSDSKFAKKQKVEYRELYTKCQKEYGADVEQATAVADIISSNKRLDLVIGRAGTGKTSKVLTPIAHYFEKKGYTVTGIALAGIAAESLRKGIGIEAYTIHSWLGKIDEKPLNKMDVIILDEAGMVDVPLMAKISEKVNLAGAKLVAAGDHAQLPPVGKGAAFRGLVDKEEASLISKVYRQKEEWQQSATEALSKWDVEKAMLTYADAEYIVWSDTKEESIERLAREYVESWEESNKGKIITSFKNSDINQLNKSIRELLILRGNLENRKFYHIEGEDKKGNKITFRKELAVGEEIIFKNNEYKTYNIRNGTRGKILELKEESIAVKLDDGREIEVDLKEYQAINYAYALTIHAVQGLDDKKVSLLAGRGFNANLAYVGLSRFKESMRIYADKENLKDLGSLVNIMSRDGGSDLVADYRGIKAPEADIVLKYSGAAEEVRNLSALINEWCREEEAECFEHGSWGDLIKSVETRNTYAAIIAADLASHRVYIKQAGLYPNTIKIHAGLRKTELTASEKKEYEDFARYALLAKSTSKGDIEERNRLADSILRGRAEKRHLYNTWAEKLEIKPENLYQHGLNYAAKEYKNSELFAKSFARLEKLYFGNILHQENIRKELYSLYDNIKESREIRESSIAIINYTEGKILREEKGIAKLENEVKDRELYLKRAYQTENALDNIYRLTEEFGSNYIEESIFAIGEIKEGYKASDIISHIEIRDLLKRNIGLAKEVINQYKTSHEYRNALYLREDAEKKLGRFINDFDYKQIENAVKVAKGLSQEYDKVLSIFTAPTVYEWSGFTDEKGALKGEAIFRDLLVSKAAKELERVEKGALRGNFYRELLDIKDEEDNSSSDNDSDNGNPPTKESYTDRITKEINHRYTKAEKWINAYKALLETDKKYTDNLSYQDVVKRKKLQELIVGHRAALKQVFGKYKAYELRMADKKDLAELGLYKEKSFKAYITVKEKEGDELQAQQKQRGVEIQNQSIGEGVSFKGTMKAPIQNMQEVPKNQGSQIKTKKQEWKQQYSQERYSTREIYNSLYNKLPSLLPEFGFRRQNGGYVSTTNQKADGSLGSSKGKVCVYYNNPGMLIDYTRGNVSIWDYVSDNYISSGNKADVRSYLLEQAGLKDKSERTIAFRPKEHKINKPAEVIVETKVDSKLMLAVLDFAKAELFRSNNPVIDYLTKERGYSEASIKIMELGYLADKKALSRHLRAQGWNNNKINEAKKLTHYIGQSHQLIIPFKGKNGEVIGLSGRDLNYTELSAFGKYLYTKELAKSKTLLNIHNIKGSKEVVIVEGMLDCLNAHANGIKGVVALGGTSLNEDQVKLLSSMGVESITLCLDNDNAGLEGGIRALNKIKSFAPEITVKYAKLPEKIKDPDQLIKEQGKEVFERVLAEAEEVKGISTLTDLKYAETLKEVMSETSIREIGIVKDSRLSLPINIGEMITEYRDLYKSVKEYEECSSIIEQEKNSEDSTKLSFAHKQQEWIERSGALEKFADLKEKISPYAKNLPNELKNAYYHPDKKIDEAEYQAQSDDIKQVHLIEKGKTDNELEKFEILDTQLKHHAGLNDVSNIKQGELHMVSKVCSNMDSQISSFIREVGEYIKESLSDSNLAERQLEGQVYEALLDTLQGKVKLKGTAILGVKDKVRIKAEDMLKKTISNLTEAIKLQQDLRKQLEHKDLLSRELHGLQLKQSKYDITEKQELHNTINKTLGQKFERLNDKQKTRYILAGGGREVEVDLITKHKAYMRSDGKELVDKITLNKWQNREQWIKEPNIDKIMGIEKQRTAENTASINNANTKPREIEFEM